MNLRFIEAFVWVARLRSFTAAAEKLNATQAAISARIATLESDFGIKLFERDNRTVTLTPAGEELLRHGEQLLVASARMLEAISERAVAGRCVAIGIIEAVTHTWLPDLLQQLRMQVPHARVEIHSDTTFVLHEALLKGNLDVAFTSEPLTAQGICNTPICQFPMAWVAAKAAVGATAESVSDFLGAAPVLTFLRDSFVYRDVVAKLGIDSVARIHPISSIAAMVGLVRCGYGIGTLPPVVVSSALDSTEFIALTQFLDLSPIPVIASRRRQTVPPIVEPLVKLAWESARAFSGACAAEAFRASDNNL
jgi:DNA-binding transcriptional LysR family regulator